MTGRTRASPAGSSGDENPAQFSYELRQRVFDPLPKSDPRSVRVREVRQFRAATDDHGRPCWNPSTQDEAHPFPQRALMHTITHYDGVETVDNYFPAVIKGTAALRFYGDPLKKTGVWTVNRSQAKSSDRYTFRPPGGELAADAEDGCLSYLASVVVEDNSAEKKLLRQRWCGSSTLEGNRGNRHFAASEEPPGHFVDLNKSKPKLAASLSEKYITPRERYLQSYKQQREVPASQQAGEAGEPDAVCPASPAVFKMSIIDAWWGMDPVATSARPTAKR